jgi:hypothetical protein
VTIVEPGSARTDFASRSAVLSPSLGAYTDTPAGVVRRRIEPGVTAQPGDPAKMVQAIIASADRNPAPKRLALGSDAYRNIRMALSERLAELDAQKEIALSTDFSN